MKKTTALAAVLLILLLFCCGCGKKTKESVEIHIAVPNLVMDCIAYPDCVDTAQFLQKAWNQFAAQYEKYTVSLAGNAVQQFEQTEYRENIPDRYGTPEAVDLTFGGYFMLGSYINDGCVIPLDDIITDKIFYEFSGGAWAQSKGINGKTYMMPFYSLQNILCYNADLFAQCGLVMRSNRIIQGWSLDTWEQVLSVLAEKLPEGAYPMMMYAKNNQGDTHTMLQIRCMGSEFFDENGLFHLETPEGIAGLQWLKDNYDKGYYPAGCESMEILDCQELFRNGKLAIYVYNSSISGSYEGMNLGYVNFPGADSYGVNTNWMTGFMAFDNGDKRKIEVVKDFLRFVYGTPEIMDYSTGGNPCAKSVVERWHEQLPMDYEYIENEDYTVDFTANNPNWTEVREVFWPHIQSLLTGRETAGEAAAGIDADCNAAILRVERRLHE